MTKSKIVIIDNNPLSLASYSEEYPEHWAKIEKAMEVKYCPKCIQMTNHTENVCLKCKERK